MTLSILSGTAFIELAKRRIGIKEYIRVSCDDDPLIPLCSSTLEKGCSMSCVGIPLQC